MRVDSHTQDWQATRVLIHTHISCRLLVEGSAPKPLFEHRISFCGYTFCERFFVYTRCPVSEHRGRESLTPFANMICPKIGLPLESGMAKCHPGFLLSATVATVATVLRVPHKTPSRPLRALRFTRLLQTQVLPPPCRSAGYAARRAWFCSHTLPDVLPTGGWHSHSDVW